MVSVDEDRGGRLEHVELPDSEACCGSAGIYSLLRPDDGHAVFEEKLEALRRCGARSLITANPGCQLQWSAGLRRSGLDVPVVHIASLVARSLDGGREDRPVSPPPRPRAS